jgi:CRISPR-associated protein Cas6
MNHNLETTSRVDLVFPLLGQSIPRDHAYLLYSAVSHLIDQPNQPPIVHESKDLGIFPIRGTPGGKGELLLNDRSYLRLRTTTDKLPKLLALAGKALDLAGRRLRVGVPRVQALVPAVALSSPLVLIKLARPPGEHDKPPVITPETFLASAQKKLDELQIHAQASLQLNQTGPHKDQPRRRILQVKNHKHVGYAMLVQGLTAEESIRLQEIGLGGRRLMGCGLFLPVGE